METWNTKTLHCMGNPIRVAFLDNGKWVANLTDISAGYGGNSVSDLVDKLQTKAPEELFIATFDGTRRHYATTSKGLKEVIFFVEAANNPKSKQLIQNIVQKMKDLEDMIARIIAENECAMEGAQ